MAGGRLVPIVIGVGDVINRSLELENALEPMELMLQAIQLAIEDTQLQPSAARELQSNIDSIDVVATWTWPYTNLPSLLSKRLNIEPQHSFYSPHGGNQPAKLFDEAARRISLGESKIAVVTGGEALASLSACVRAKKMPPPGWTILDQTVDSVFAPTLGKEESVASLHSVGLPIHVYPMYENGFRAFRGQSIQQNIRESARLYANFSKVASQNPLAWTHGKAAETEQSLSTVTKRNRIICSPYPLLMNAFNTVNLAGACLLTSVDLARELGIPQTQWIYPLGGAGTRDSYDFWERPNFHSSPSISRSLDAALENSGLRKDQIDLYDFYSFEFPDKHVDNEPFTDTLLSCFPIVPKLACQHLGLSITEPSKPITLLGGLTSFGGAGNNYSMHALTEMVRELRKGISRHGLVLANGGLLTYQYVICLSSQPRNRGSPYPDGNPLPEVLTDPCVRPLDAQAEGQAIIEASLATYTVEYNRDGAPIRGHIVGRLRSTGHRFIANHADTTTLLQLSSGTEEQIGRSGWVGKDLHRAGRNLFSFENCAHL